MLRAASERTFGPGWLTREVPKYLRKRVRLFAVNNLHAKARVPTTNTFSKIPQVSTLRPKSGLIKYPALVFELGALRTK